ncbi:YdeI/OmpD-associated family protein [Kribbella deserti]|uniref:YdeI family protein n=1 Tax=Kribbella deserti TaxID=1926257 RepID=A0ABV6QG35_9ACTN
MPALMETFAAPTTAEWRNWLAEYGETAQEVWLVIYHKDSGTPSVRYHEAIEHALCFGWIDSHARSNDGESSLLRFSPRSPRSTWSAVNRERAARMTGQGLMTPRGQAMIDLAQAKGTWEVKPDDETAAALNSLLDQNPVARENFEKFPPSSKRLILEWIAGAKKAETRQRRIDQTVELAAANIRANHR